MIWVSILFELGQKQVKFINLVPKFIYFVST